MRGREKQPDRLKANIVKPLGYDIGVGEFFLTVKKRKKEEKLEQENFKVSRNLGKQEATFSTGLSSAWLLAPCRRNARVS